MRVNIHEAGHDHEAASVDGFVGGALIAPPREHDGTVPECDIPVGNIGVPAFIGVPTDDEGRIPDNGGGGHDGLVNVGSALELEIETLVEARPVETVRLGAFDTLAGDQPHGF